MMDEARIRPAAFWTVSGGFLLLLVSCGGNGGPPARNPLSGVTVAVSPATATVAVGDSQQFTGSVTGTTKTAVNWSVNGIAGGDEIVGTISTEGVYAAPETVPSPNTITVTATSQVDPTASASANVMVTAKLAALDPVVALQSAAAFVLTAAGGGFTPASQVVFNGVVKSTVFVSSSELRADISSDDLAVPGTFTVVVQDGESTTSALEFFVVPRIARQDVLVTAGLENSGVDIAVSPIPSPGLSVLAAGIGDTAGSIGVSAARGAEVDVLLVGEGLVPGTYYAIGGSLDEFEVTQPVVADFTETTDGTPAVNFKVLARPDATPGSRNILVLNTSGEVAAFVGGLRVTE